MVTQQPEGIERRIYSLMMALIGLGITYAAYKIIPSFTGFFYLVNLLTVIPICLGDVALFVMFPIAIPVFTVLMIKERSIVGGCTLLLEIPAYIISILTVGVISASVYYGWMMKFVYKQNI